MKDLTKVTLSYIFGGRTRQLSKKETSKSEYPLLGDVDRLDTCQLITFLLVPVPLF